METIQNLLQQVTTMRWSDYLDIALVTILIYKILPLIKAPSTMRIARAVVAVVAIAAIAGIVLNAILPGKDYEFGTNPDGDQNRGIHH